MKKSSKKRSRGSSTESSTSSSSDSSSSSSSSSSGSNRRKSKKAKKPKKKSSKIAKKKGYNPKRFFKIEKKEDKNSWKVDNNFACYANDMIKSFIKDSDVKSSILEKLPVPSNIKEVQDVDLWLSAIYDKHPRLTYLIKKDDSLEGNSEEDAKRVRPLIQGVGVHGFTKKGRVTKGCGRK